MNAQPFNGQIPTPDITLTGAMVERLAGHLNNQTVLIRGPDGLMHPFVDALPVLAILQEVIVAELKRRGTIPDQPIMTGPSAGLAS